MAQINGPKDASEERCVRRVEFRIARTIRHRHLTEGEILTQESLVQRGLIERDDAQYVVDALDNLTARGMLDHVFAYSYLVKRSRQR